MTVHVNEAAWNTLSAADKDKINKIIGDNFKGEKIEPKAGHDEKLFSNPACTTACNVAEGIATQACGSLGPIAGPICVIAAHAAGEFCRSRC